MPMRIVHVITRLILGGAQENTVLCCEDLDAPHGDEVLLVTGPPLGPEGSLLERARAGGVPLEIIDSLRRPIHPWRDPASYRQRSSRRFAASGPRWCTPTAPKAGMLGRAAAWSLGVPAVDPHRPRRAVPCRSRAGGRGGFSRPANAGPPAAAMPWSAWPTP